jgi:hypothetical protein
MSEAIQIIDQEIDQVSEMLKHHAYQLQVLQDLRKKMDSVSGQVYLSPFQEDLEETRTYTKISDEEVLSMAKKLARKIRKEGGTKEGHLREMWRSGELTYGNLRAYRHKMYPSNIGRDKYNEIFKGTKYASKAG